MVLMTNTALICSYPACSLCLHELAPEPIGWQILCWHHPRLVLSPHWLRPQERFPLHVSVWEKTTKLWVINKVRSVGSDVWWHHTGGGSDLVRLTVSKLVKTLEEGLLSTVDQNQRIVLVMFLSWVFMSIQVSDANDVCDITQVQEVMSQILPLSTFSKSLSRTTSPLSPSRSTRTMSEISFCLSNA